MEQPEDTMATEPAGIPDTPMYHLHSNLNSQWKMAPKLYNVSITSSNQKISREKFKELQLELIKMVIKNNPTAQFKLYLNEEKHLNNETNWDDIGEPLKVVGIVDIYAAEFVN